MAGAPAQDAGGGGSSASTAETQSCRAFRRKGIKESNPYLLVYFPTVCGPCSLGVGMGLNSAQFSLSVLSLHSDNGSDQRVRWLTGTGTPMLPGPIRDPQVSSLHLKMDSDPGSVSKPSYDGYNSCPWVWAALLSLIGSKGTWNQKTQASTRSLFTCTGAEPHCPHPPSRAMIPTSQPP